MAKGQLVIVSGPSGAGKTSVVKKLIDSCPVLLQLSVSATTRPARPGEKDGVDYHFLTDKEFQERRQAGEFLECFEVFGRGYWYGTLQKEVDAALEEGRWVLLEIDVNGMQQVAEKHPEAMSIFIRTRSLEELEQRLRDRKTENEDTIRRRLEVAQHEWPYKDQYRFDVVNDQLDETVEQICELLKSASASS